MKKDKDKMCQIISEYHDKLPHLATKNMPNSADLPTQSHIYTHRAPTHANSHSHEHMRMRHIAPAVMLESSKYGRGNFHGNSR